MQKNAFSEKCRKTKKNAEKRVFRKMQKNNNNRFCVFTFAESPLFVEIEILSAETINPMFPLVSQVSNFVFFFMTMILDSPNPLVPSIKIIALSAKS